MNNKEKGFTVIELLYIILGVVVAFLSVYLLFTVIRALS